MCATFRKADNVRAANLSGVHPDSVDAPSNATDGGEVPLSDMSEGRSIAKDRSGVARDTDAAVGTRARSAQVTGAVTSVSGEAGFVEKPSDLVGDAVDNEARLVPRELTVRRWH